MLVMPLLCKYKAFRFKPIVNLGLMIGVPYIFEALLYMIPNYQENTIIHDLFSCFLYFPCFLVGFWMAQNKIPEKFKSVNLLRNPFVSIVGVGAVFIAKMCLSSVLGFLFDVFYAPLMILFLMNIFEQLGKYKIINIPFSILGKYSTGMWFFHAVFFSTYVCDWFLPVLNLVSFPPLMFVWLTILSLLGAFVFGKALDGLKTLPKLFKRRL